MYDDILGKIEKSDEILNEVFTEEYHPTWCAVYCIQMLNEMVDIGIMTVSGDGNKPLIITEKGEKHLDYYWNEIKKRKPNDNDIELGMAILKNEGVW